MHGRENTGSFFFTLMQLNDLAVEVKREMLDKFGMEIEKAQKQKESANQNFPFTQSKNHNSINVCQVCW